MWLRLDWRPPLGFMDPCSPLSSNFSPASLGSLSPRRLRHDLLTPLICLVFCSNSSAIRVKQLSHVLRCRKPARTNVHDVAAAQRCLGIIDDRRKRSSATHRRSGLSPCFLTCPRAMEIRDRTDCTTLYSRSGLEIASLVNRSKSPLRRAHAHLRSVPITD